MKIKWIYILVIVTLASLLGGAVYGPRLIDWNEHKVGFRTAVFDATGCHLSIDGQVSLDLFPRPKISFNDVRLTEDSQIGAPNVMTVKSVKAALSLREILQGQIKIDYMELHSPKLLIAVGEKKLCDKAALGMRVVSSLNPSGGDNGNDLKIDLQASQIKISNGIFPIKIPGQKENVKISHVNFQIDMLNGGTRALLEGTVAANEIAINAKFSINNMQKGRAPSINGALSFPSMSADLTLVGNMTQPVGAGAILKGAFNGEVNFKAEDSKLFLKELAPGYVAGMAGVPLMFDSEIQVTSRYIGLNNYNFENGPLRGTGSVSTTLGLRPEFDIIFSAQTLDLDDIIAKMPIREISNAKIIATPAVGTLMKDAASQSLSIIEVPGEGVRSSLLDYDVLLERLVRDIDSDISLDITVGALKYADGIIREAGLHATFGDGSLILDRASVLLPGGTDLSLFGFLEKVDSSPIFDGDLTLQSDDFRRFLEWADVTDRLFQTSRLRSMAYHSQLRLTPDVIQLSNIDATVDASSITGHAGLYFENEFPKLMLDIGADQINLDAYFGFFDDQNNAFPLMQDVQTLTNNNSPKSISATSLNSHMQGMTFDANIRLTAGQVSLFNESAQDILLDMQVLAGDLTLKTFEFKDFSSFKGAADGTIKNIFNTPNFNLTLKVESPNVSSTLSRFGIDPDVVRFAHDAGSVEGRVVYVGPLNEGLVDISIVSDKDKAKLHGVLSVLSDRTMLSIEKAEYKGRDWYVGNINGILSSDEDSIVKLRTLEADLLGAKILISNFHITDDIQSGYRLNTKGQMKGLPLQSAMSDLGGLIAVSGMLNMEFEAHSQAHALLSLASNLSAKGDMSGEASLAISKNKQSASLQIKPMENLQNFLVRHFGTKLYPLSGRYVWQDNKFQADSILVESLTADITAKSTIDLARQNTTATLSIKEKGRDGDYLTLNISGPWTDPSVKSSGVWINGSN